MWRVLLQTIGEEGLANLSIEQNRRPHTLWNERLMRLMMRRGTNAGGLNASSTAPRGPRTSRLALCFGPAEAWAARKRLGCGRAAAAERQQNGRPVGECVSILLISERNLNSGGLASHAARPNSIGHYLVYRPLVCPEAEEEEKEELGRGLMGGHGRGLQLCALCASRSSGGGGQLEVTPRHAHTRAIFKTWETFSSLATRCAAHCSKQKLIRLNTCPLASICTTRPPLWQTGGSNTHTHTDRQTDTRQKLILRQERHSVGALGAMVRH